MPLEAGTRLGPYEILAPLGAGGSGLWVRSLDAAKSRLLAGTEDTDCPFWSPDARSIDSPDRRHPVGRRLPLFKIPGDILNLSLVAQFDVSADGRHFLMNLDTPSQVQRTITLVSNWTSLLKKR